MSTENQIDIRSSGGSDMKMWVLDGVISWVPLVRDEFLPVRGCKGEEILLGRNVWSALPISLDGIRKADTNDERQFVFGKHFGRF